MAVGEVSLRVKGNRLLPKDRVSILQYDGPGVRFPGGTWLAICAIVPPGRLDLSNPDSMSPYYTCLLVTMSLGIGRREDVRSIIGALLVPTLGTIATHCCLGTWHGEQASLSPCDLDFHTQNTCHHSAVHLAGVGLRHWHEGS